MTWVFAIIALGLLAFIVEGWLAYQKESDQITTDQEAARAKIQTLVQKIEESGSRTEELREDVQKVEAQIGGLKKQLKEANTHLGELEEKDQRRHPTRHRLEETQDENTKEENS